MTDDDARTLLVRQGALLLSAHMKMIAAKLEWQEIAASLNDIVLPGVDEQIQCFRESCTLAGLDPADPRLQAYWDSFNHERGSDLEDRLLAQLENAAMN